MSPFLLAASLLLAQQAQGVPPVRIDPPEVELQVGDTVRLRAFAAGSNAALATDEVRWLVGLTEVVSVDGSGLVTALRPGTARVTAATPAGVGFAEVRVLQLPASDLEISAPTLELTAGTSLPLAVRARTRLGEVLEDPPLRFESLTPTITRVDRLGRVYGLAPGDSRIRVASGPAVDEIGLRILPDPGVEMRITPEDAEVRTGDVVHFQVIGAQGNRVTVHPAWTVSGTGAEITPEEGSREGVFVAEKPGVYRVTALIGEGRAESTIVTVVPREVATEILLVGRGAISHHNSGDMWVFEGVDGRDYVYVGTYLHDWMKVWDVTDPENPVLTDSLQLDARRINDVKIHPTRPLGILTREGASNRRNGIVLLDLARPAHPAVLAEYTESLTGGVHNVWIEGDHVYAVHNGTSDVHILDISNPRAVREVGRWGLESQRKSLHDVIVQEGYAYVSYWDDGVVILDVGAGTHGGSPASPTFVSRYSYPEGNTHVAWRHGDYLFVGDEIFPADWDASRPIEARGYIHVLDVTDIDHPVEVARYEVPEAGAHNVWVEDDLLYVGYYQGGLRVVDISGELRGDLYAQGREVAWFKTADADAFVPNWPMTWGAQVFKGRIYSSDLNSGIWITRLAERPRIIF